MLGRVTYGSTDYTDIHRLDASVRFDGQTAERSRLQGGWGTRSREPHGEEAFVNVCPTRLASRLRRLSMRDLGRLLRPSLQAERVGPRLFCDRQSV